MQKNEIQICNGKGTYVLKKEHKKSYFRIKIIIGLIAAMTIAFAVVAAAADNSYNITITDSGKSIQVQTDKRDVNEILMSQSIKTRNSDKIDISSFIPGKGGEIVISRAYKVKINYHSQTFETMAAGTVYDAIAKCGISLNRTDVVDKYFNDIIDKDTTISIVSGVEIKVDDSGETFLYGVPTDSTVENALKYAGVNLGDDDELSVDKNENVRRNMIVKVKRVKFKDSNGVIDIKYKTVKKESTEIAVGITKVITKGENGKNQVVYRSKYVDGVFTGREIIYEKVLKDATNEVIFVGKEKETTTSSAIAVMAKNSSSSKSNFSSTTKSTASTSSSGSTVRTISNFSLPSKYSLDSSGKPANYKSKMSGSATAYYGGTSTSIGKKPQPGYIAVNPDIIPYGTEMWIVSNDGKFVYGYAIAADTGGFIYSGSTIADLYFNTYNECVNFGRRDITIYILS